MYFACAVADDMKIKTKRYYAIKKLQYHATFAFICVRDRTIEKKVAGNFNPGYFQPQASTLEKMRYMQIIIDFKNMFLLVSILEKNNVIDFRLKKI